MHFVPLKKKKKKEFLKYWYPHVDKKFVRAEIIHCASQSVQFSLREQKTTD